MIPGHVSIAGDGNIMIGSAVNQSGLFFFFRGFLSLIPHRGQGARWSFYSCGGTSSEGDREEWMLLGGTPPASASLPHLLHLRRVAASPSRVYRPPFHPFQSQALPSAFPHTSKQPSGEIRLVETWGLQSTAKGMNHLESRSFNL